MMPRFAFLFFLALALAWGMGCFPAHAASPDLLAPGSWNLATPHVGDASLSAAPLADAPGTGDVLTVTIKTPSDPLWGIQLQRGIRGDIPSGHRVNLHFWARSETRNPMRVTVEQSVPPYGAVGSDMLVLTAPWREYTVGGVTPGYGPDGVSAHFQVGTQAGVVEIAGATVTDSGTDMPTSAIRAALRPESIQARIEKYRKGKMTIRVVDASGKPVSSAYVQVTQTRHAFLFGCNFFGLDPVDRSPAQTAYRTEFAALFNYATLPFYWGAYETTAGKTDDVRLQAMAAWCVAHGIAPKGHPLVWHEVWPTWAPNDPDDAVPLLQARAADLIPRYGKTIHYWDVVNEANGAAQHSPANGETAWVKRDGAASVVETALGWARAAGRGLLETFTYNDYETGQANVALLTRLQADGKLPDAIGLQSHMHSGEWPLSNVWETCETFRRFGRPIHFTETTVLSGSRRMFNFSDPPATDWNTTPEGEARQADYVAQFYTLLFSHPAVRAITWWDFSDHDAWLGAPAGLVRRDMSPKPAYTRLMDLIHRQWWTKIAGRTGRTGTYAARVFYGDYRITVTDAHGKTTTRVVTFPEGAPPQQVTIRLPLPTGGGHGAVKRMHSV